jgi:hypothetical protein
MRVSRWFKAVAAIGGAALLFAAGAVAAQTFDGQTFTIAVVPDTQNYADVLLPQPRGAQTFEREMQYLADQRGAKNIAFVTFVGDLIQHGDGQFRTAAGPDGLPPVVMDTRAEWDIANRAVSILGRSGVPFGMVPGNHDYDNYAWWSEDGGPGPSRPLAGSRAWSFYFGPTSRHFAGKAWYGGASENGLNSFQTFEGGGKRFLHLSLEMDPPTAALDWAQAVLDAHPGLPVIVSTHEWLAPSKTGETLRSNSYASLFAGADHATPDQVWDRFIRKNPAIFMVLSGHAYTPAVEGVSLGENLRIDHNDAGYPVYQVLQDFQGNTVGPEGGAGSANGGGGWLRFMEFDAKCRKIRLYTYSPLLDRYAGRDGEETFGVAARYSEFELDFPTQLLNGRQVLSSAESGPACAARSSDSRAFRSPRE